MKICLAFKLGLLLLAGILSSPAYAQEEKDADFFILYGVADYEDQLVSGLDPSAMVFRFVPATDNWIGYEGRLGLGIAEGSDNVNSFLGSGEVEVDVHTIVGIYLNTYSRPGDALSIYGVAGYTWVRYDLKFDGLPLLDAEDESGFAYGVGVELGIRKSMKLNLEFMQYLDKSDFDLSAISLGVSF